MKPMPEYNVNLSDVGSIEDLATEFNASLFEYGGDNWQTLNLDAFNDILAPASYRVVLHTENEYMNIRALDDTEVAGFDSERKWLDDFLRYFGPEHLLKRTPDDIPTLQSLLDVKPFSTGEEAALEILGAAFGDVVAATFGFEWVVATDEYGADFAIKHPSKMILAFPRDMIVKRVETGDVINLTELYHSVIAAIKEQIDADVITSDR